MALGAYQQQVMRGNTLSQIANPVVFNPLAAQAQGMDLAQKNLALQNAQGQQLWGQALQQATDANGNVDYQKAQGIASRMGPAAASYALQALQATTQQRSAQQTQAMQHMQLVGTAGLSLVSDPSDGNLEAVRAKLLNAGMAPSLVNPEIDSMKGMSLDDRKQAAFNHGLAAMDPNTAMSRVAGQTTLQNQGNVITAQTVTPASPGRPASVVQGQGSVPLGPTPEWLNETVQVPDLNKTLPNGQPNPNYGGTTPMTRQEYLTAHGVDPTKLSPSGQPAQGGPLGTGRLPPALQNPNKPANVTPVPASSPNPPAAPLPQPSPAAPASPFGGGAFVPSTSAPAPTPPPAATPVATATRPVGSTASPGEEEAMKAAGPRFQAESDSDTAAQGQLSQLGTMLSDLGRFQSGSGAGKTLDWKRAAVSWAPQLAARFGIKPDEVAAQESFDKVAAQLAQTQGANSDYRMGVNQAANPHSSLSPEGADFIIRSLQGNADYLRARAAAARAWPSKSDYQGFQTSIAGLDPRAFQLARMTNEQRTSYWNSLDSEAKKQVGSAIKQVFGG